jgi:hypothetical protein
MMTSTRASRLLKATVVGGTVKEKKGVRGTDVHKFAEVSILWIRINKLIRAQLRVAMLRGIPKRTLLNDCSRKGLVRKDLIALMRIM